MTPERFRELWADAYREFPPTPIEVSITARAWQLHLREALTAFIESEAMREKAEIDCDCTRTPCQHDWTDADWINATWQKWLGREP